MKIETYQHKLPTETGRWNNTDSEDIIYRKCGNRALGDEYHYIMEYLSSVFKY